MPAAELTSVVASATGVEAVAGAGVGAGAGAGAGAREGAPRVRPVSARSSSARAVTLQKASGYSPPL